MKKPFLLIFSLLMVTAVSAQQVLKGRVVSTDGRPVAGAILSTSGFGSAVTDDEGCFTLTPTISRGTVRVWSEECYPLEVALSEDFPATLVLVPLSERDYSGTVLLPTATVGRAQAPATVQTTARKDMSDSPSAVLAWQDVDASLSVSRKSGMPGEGGYYNIRGLHTLNADNTPLLVINGVPHLSHLSVSDVINAYSRDALFGYNAHDIRSITVLKGADAALYGSLGSNGVILIETEQATSDKLDTRISYSGSFGLAAAQRQMPVLGADDYQDYLMTIGQTRYSSLAALQKDYPFLQGGENYYSYLFRHDTDWVSGIYRRALVTDHVLRVEGGDEVAKYNISFGYTSENGVLGRTASDRYHTAMNTHIAVTSDFDIVTSVNLAYRSSRLGSTGMNEEANPILSAYHIMPLLSPWQELPDGGVIDRYLAYDGWNTNAHPTHPYDNVSNPLAIVRTVEGTDKVYDADIRLGADYRLGTSWTLTGLLNLYSNYTEEYLFTPGVTDRTILPQLYGTGENFVSMGVIRQNTLYGDIHASYRNTFAHVHDLKAVGGIRYLRRNSEYDASSGYNTANDYYRSLSKVTDEWNIFGDNDDWRWLSGYLHGDYTYDNLLRASLGVTIDGSSTFGADAPLLALYPSASVTYMAASGGRLPSAVDHLNITAEASLSGNSRYSGNYARNHYVSSNLFNLGTIVRHGVPNTALEGEKKAQADLGVDGSFLGNRLNARVNAFASRSYDLLFDSQISAVYGSNEPYYDNTAAIGSHGVELSLRANPVHNTRFDWVLTASGAWMRSRVTALGDRDRYIQDYTFYNDDDAQTLLSLGREPYEFYGYQTAGIYATTADALQPTPATGQPLKNSFGNCYQGGDVIFVDQNGDGIIDDRDRTPLGDARPDVFGSFGTSLRWRSLTLTADFGYSLGAKAYNATRRQMESMDNFCNQSTAVLSRWQLEGQEATLPRAAYGDPSGNNIFSDRWLEDASFLKLRQLQLSYALGGRLLRFVKGSVWLAAENLWTLTPYLGGDPEFSYSYAEALRGFDYAKVTNPVTFKLGFNLNF